jgi:hypothetical protein
MLQTFIEKFVHLPTGRLTAMVADRPSDGNEQA